MSENWGDESKKVVLEKEWERKDEHGDMYKNGAHQL
jgi:hypothetical protein